MSSTITVRGWVGNKPALTRTPHDRTYTNVRVAATHRYRDARNEWVDGDTQWFSAVFWDDAAQNVARSVRQGEPVILTGRLVLDRWDGEDGPRSALGVRGATIGHDLTRGQAQFTRWVRTAPGGFEPVPPEGPAGDAARGAGESDDPSVPPPHAPGEDDGADEDDGTEQVAAALEDGLSAFERATA